MRDRKQLLNNIKGKRLEYYLHSAKGKKNSPSLLVFLSVSSLVGMKYIFLLKDNLNTQEGRRFEFNSYAEKYL